jgi:hypothetical protein
MSNSAPAFAEASAGQPAIALASAGSLLRSRRAFSRPGFPLSPRLCLTLRRACLLSPLPLRILPHARGGRSAGRRYPHFDRARKARPHVCETQPPRGKPERASRRSTLAILGPLRALRLRSCLRLARAGNLAARVSRPTRPRSRTSWAADTAAPRDATPRSACGIVSGDATRERG